MRKPYTVIFSDDVRTRSFERKHDAEVFAQNNSHDGDVIGIEHGKSSRFFIRRGRTLYPIGVEAAAFELAMKGGSR